MNSELRFILTAIKKNLKNKAVLKASFFILIFGMFVNNIAFILIWGFFVESVGEVGGWDVKNIIGLQAITGLVYGIVYSVGDGIRKISDDVTSGKFDRYLLSPKNLYLRIIFSSLDVTPIGDVIFGIVFLGIFFYLINVNLLQFTIAIIMVIFAVSIFTAVNLFIQSWSFYFTDSEKVTSGMFDLFFAPSLFHGGAFQGMTRTFFIFVIPSLLIGTIPIEAIRNISYTQIAVAGILSVIWVFISILSFNRGLRKYESANMITFGS